MAHFKLPTKSLDGSSEEMYPIRSCGILAGRLPGGSETEKASESEPLKGRGDGYG